MHAELLDLLDGLSPELELGDDGLPIKLTVTIDVQGDVEKLTTQLKETIVQLRLVKVPV